MMYVVDPSEVPSVRVQIPTSAGFLEQWHLWVHGKVSKHFKRDKERIPDTVQRVRLRLLTKDFVSRWFFKHLTYDVVDLSEAMNMLGGVPVTYVGKLLPTHGGRSSNTSLWRVSDLLEYARFDYERYFYSVQRHTLDTERALRLLGCGHSVNDYGMLESLYRQGRLKPSELTEHACVEKSINIPHPDGLCGVPGCDAKHYARGFCSTHYGASKVKTCAECERGRASLRARGVSLVDRWTDPAVASAVSKLRWNDSQLIPFLREWRNSNKIKGPPRYIMRTPTTATVDAGLLKYANNIIDHDVINHFKSMARSDDLANMVFEGRADPETSGIETVGWEQNDVDGTRNPVFIDTSAAFSDSVEGRADLVSIMSKACLTDDEVDVIYLADLEESSVREVSEALGFTVSKVNRIRSSAMTKMRQVVCDDEAVVESA